MPKKYTFSGYDLAWGAYLGLIGIDELPEPPDGFKYGWKFSTSDVNDNKQYELSFTLVEKEKEPAPEPYEAGDWKDPEVDEIINKNKTGG